MLIYSLSNHDKLNAVILARGTTVCCRDMCTDSSNNQEYNYKTKFPSKYDDYGKKIVDENGPSLCLPPDIWSWVDSTTVFMHSLNFRRIGLCTALSVAFKNGGNSHRSHEHIMHCSFPSIHWFCSYSQSNKRWRQPIVGHASYPTGCAAAKRLCSSLWGGWWLL